MATALTTDTSENSGALRDLIDCYPAPALLVSHQGEIQMGNDHAVYLANALKSGLSSVSALIEQVDRSGKTHVQDVHLPGGSGDQIIDLTIISLDSGILMLGRDATLERNMIRALATSRQLLKDIVECLSDFSWEADAEGILTFVAPRKIYGYAAVDLVGRRASDLIDNEWSFGRPNPFEADTRIDGTELWLISQDGTRVCTCVSSLPIYNTQGTRIATRGVCRDVTVTRAREAALTQALDRERLRGAVVEAMRSPGGPKKAVRIAAEASMAALRGHAVIVLRRGQEGGFVRTVTTGTIPEDIEARLLREAKGIAEIRQQSEVKMITEGDHALLVCPARQDGIMIGLIGLLRPATQPWLPEQGSLLAAVADQLALALTLIERVEQLERLSRIDALTGLLNRRAFSEELPRKLRLCDRLARQGCMLLIDLDDFKALNDCHGHQTGDRVLEAVGTLMNNQTRGDDLAVRLGGDEFALWLSECDAAGGMAKGHCLLEAINGLGKTLKLDGLTFGVSIGVAVYEPSSVETEDGLISRADVSLYSAKRGGRNQVRLAV